ncbi:MAG: hypothetical protein DRH97_00105 [Chloroflexi bacterium]|nr:MAG: hypothetical protein DRH97_00105 [Chloroflexota bacterium]
MIYFLVIISFALSIGAECLPDPEYINCGVNHNHQLDLVYGWMRVLVTTIVILQVFLLVSYKDMKLKTITFLHFCWAVFNCFVTAGVEPRWFWYVPLIVFQVLTFGTCILYRTFKTIEMPQDEYSDNECYIVFSKPENFGPFLWTWFCATFSSISVVSNGIQYCFKKKKNFHLVDYTPEDHHYYLKVDFCDSHVREKLSTLYYVPNPEDTEKGTKWGLFGNCCHAVLRLYPNKVTCILSFLPCILAKQLMRYENDRQNDR